MSDRYSILIAAAEVAPFARVGGLGEVTASMARALEARGHDVAIVLPKYLAVDQAGFQTEPIDVPLLHRIQGDEQTGWIHKAVLPGSEIPVFLVTNDAYFNRSGLYQEDGRDYSDNLARFTFYCRGVMDLILSGHVEPEIVHCYSWQTALIPAYLRFDPRYAKLRERLKVCFTFQSIAFQGCFPKDSLPISGLPWEVFTPEGIEFYGDLNLLKGGIVYSDVVTTVGERYAAEIMTPEHGCGMDPIVRSVKSRLHGILNGLDYEEWDPLNDASIPKPFGPSDLSGKAECKAALQDELGLPVDAEIPLVVGVAPFEDPRESQLVTGALDVLLLGQEIQFVALETENGEPSRTLRDLQSRFPLSVQARRTGDESLDHRLKAGADMFLLPSRKDDAGWRFLTCLRYGAPPVSRQAGGLAEAVRDFNEAQRDGYGFLYGSSDPKDLLQTLRRALTLYRDKTAWTALQRRGMARDFSWRGAAARYETLYHDLLEAPS